MPDHNRFEQQYAYQFILFRSVCIIFNCNSNLHIGGLGFKLSQREVYSILDKPLIENKGAGVLPACCDIDRACPSLMQQRTKLS